MDEFNQYFLCIRTVIVKQYYLLEIDAASINVDTIFFLTHNQCNLNVPSVSLFICDKIGENIDKVFSKQPEAMQITWLNDPIP